MKELIVNKEKITIRKAKESDAEVLIEYLNIIGGQSNDLTFGEGEFGRTVEAEREFIKNALEKNNALFIIAEVDGKVVGNLNFSGGPRKRIAHVGEFGVSVLKEYWGNRIGEELIRYLIDWSKNSKIIKKINLRVRTENKRGIGLYKKLGFLEEGVLKRDYLIDGEFYDSLLMGLLID
ncbi:GNAT family N-acetyltransferase [Clostridiaceae bacterium UIB06]|uniref:GNAT family N-acetyltransferase n=1 Tax=Clostridium thailandense TaxID=2794346 RepID=A0A949WTP3_9CLOT|nr:GNAT family protein [Clostridium thailandense]MBV7276560.1 GNAT family N-acetyltransferase [Clostridium thailandense]MCH5137586.1 GNAT family N-acetyltransferase [Clostridiaceae bacterium UIB06]